MADRWLQVEELVLVDENDGPTFLRHGAQRAKTKVSLDDAVKNHGREKVVRALREAIVNVERYHKT